LDIYLNPVNDNSGFQNEVITAKPREGADIDPMSARPGAARKAGGQLANLGAKRHNEV
jgi:hypothetical protein